MDEPGGHCASGIRQTQKVRLYDFTCCGAENLTVTEVENRKVGAVGGGGCQLAVRMNASWDLAHGVVTIVQSTVLLT